jgi:hypothetical protein
MTKWLQEKGDHDYVNSKISPNIGFTSHEGFRASSVHTANLTVMGFCSENLQTRGCLHPNLHSKQPLRMQ